MCLAVPMSIKSIQGTQALVENQGVELWVNISLVPEARIGEAVIVHAGFAIERLSPEEEGSIRAVWDEYEKTLEDE
jgi:hydrogenase expression/formation protein HypC